MATSHAPRPMSRRRALAAGFSAAAAVAGISAVAPSAQAADPTPLKYVAMGDSYSAASGVLPLDPKITPLCMRSTSNYPNVIAQATGAQLTDVTCGGAKTKDYYSAQYPGLTRPQLDALGPETQLVTMTIGGNDADTFVGAILACGSAGSASLSYGSPCKDLYKDTFTKKVDNEVGPNVMKAVADVRRKAPNARVAILSYPMILPETFDPSCYAKMPIARGDVAYMNDLQKRLNGKIKEAAVANGAEFVDVASASVGHDACKPAGTRWVEPVLWGTNVVPVHPNALGESQMGVLTMRQLGL